MPINRDYVQCFVTYNLIRDAPLSIQFSLQSFVHHLLLFFFFIYILYSLQFYNTLSARRSNQFRYTSFVILYIFSYIILCHLFIIIIHFILYIFFFYIMSFIISFYIMSFYYFVIYDYYFYIPINFIILYFLLILNLL